MNDLQMQFNGFWEECYHAIYYQLYSTKAPLHLKDRNNIRALVQKEVQDRFIGAGALRQGGAVWLEALETSFPKTGASVRKRLLAFHGAGGVNTSLVLGLAAGSAASLLFTLIFLILPGFWILTTLLSLVCLAGTIFTLLSLIKNAGAYPALKQAFDSEGERIRRLLEAP